MIRQGDVLLVPTRRPKGRAMPTQAVVLALGEATGHQHVLRGDVEPFEIGGLTVLVVRKPAELRHETAIGTLTGDHATVTVPPGTYEARRQREYTPQAIRTVGD